MQRERYVLKVNTLQVNLLKRQEMILYPLPLVELKSASDLKKTKKTLIGSNSFQIYIINFFSFIWVLSLQKEDGIEAQAKNEQDWLYATPIAFLLGLEGIIKGEFLIPLTVFRGAHS